VILLSREKSAVLPIRTVMRIYLLAELWVAATRFTAAPDRKPDQRGTFESSQHDDLFLLVRTCISSRLIMKSSSHGESRPVIVNTCGWSARFILHSRKASYS
jgi:hypothetical protein